MKVQVDSLPPVKSDKNLSRTSWQYQELADTVLNQYQFFFQYKAVLDFIFAYEENDNQFSDQENFCKFSTAYRFEVNLHSNALLEYSLSSMQIITLFRSDFAMLDSAMLTVFTAFTSVTFVVLNGNHRKP